MTLSQSDKGDYVYLSDVSPSDKPWDVHRLQACHVQQLYSGTIHDRLAYRVSNCSGLLGFGFATDTETGEARLKLKAARFCRVRHCPVCQWRRSLMWVARFLKSVPLILNQYPTTRFIFLTLTVKNCDISELRSTVQEMNLAWHRLIKRKEFPAIGFARSLEVTRSKNGEAHPHFHCLLMVKSGYFKSGNYLSQERWTDLWKESLRISYSPRVDVRAVKTKKGVPESEALPRAICETFKYSVKPEDLTANKEWLLELTSQLHKVRSISLGGVLKTFISEEEPEDLIGNDGDEPSSDVVVTFGWREFLNRYCKVE